MNAPIYMHTDASDYGIGIYLFQIIDAKEVPIHFLNKAFTKGQLRWSTTEKELYAIVYGFRKLHYLLSGVKFTLITNHQNLIYMNSASEGKIQRWKMSIMEYDFEVEHIPGHVNMSQTALDLLTLLEMLMNTSTFPQG
jgi:hypothetical protein